MKPTNRKEYNKSLLKFFLMWAVTTALIVTSIVLAYKIPFKENVVLKERVEILKQDSIQKYLIKSTLDGIDATMVSLSESYNEDTLKKLEQYPIPELDDTKMKAQLENIRDKISRIIKLSNENKDDCQENLKVCKSTLSLTEKQVETQSTQILQLESRVRELEFRLSQ